MRFWHRGGEAGNNEHQYNRYEDTEKNEDNPWDALRTVEFTGGGSN